jgi:hypothetical protein
VRSLAAVLVPALAVSWGAAACTSSRTEPAEGLGEGELPVDVRADYDVFARRCSKCHSLARPLLSGITDDAMWRVYVDWMRRQAGSGISSSDTVRILRFLHYYSLEQKRRRGGGP